MRARSLTFMVKGGMQNPLMHRKKVHAPHEAEAIAIMA